MPHFHAPTEAVMQQIEAVIAERAAETRAEFERRGHADWLAALASNDPRASVRRRLIPEAAE